MRKELLILMIIVAAIVNASTVKWSFEATAPVSLPPIEVGGSIAVLSNGFVYLISPNDGRAYWKMDVGRYPLEPIVFENDLVVITSTGRLLRISRTGDVKLDIKLPERMRDTGINSVYGIGTNGKRIFITTDRGIYQIDRNSSLSLLVQLNGTMTAPEVLENGIFVGIENELYYIRNNGNIEWKQIIGEVWKSNPSSDGDAVYIGSIDNKVYAYDSKGRKMWELDTGSWVLSTQIVEKGAVYFGTLSGEFYSVNSINGEINWRQKVQQGIKATPILGTVGGQEAVFIGSTDDNIYAFDKKTGEILWRFKGKRNINNALFSKGNLLFGSDDSSVYSITMARACTIHSPEEGEVVGFKEVKVNGLGLSQNQNPRVQLQIGAEDWRDVPVINSRWEYILNPERLKFGTSSISCRISDSQGAEIVSSDSINIVRSENLTRGKIRITAPTAIEMGSEFTVFVNDADDNSPIENFNLYLDTQNLSSSDNITLKLENEGKSVLRFEKTGFESQQIAIEAVKKGNNNMTIYLIAGAAILIIASAVVLIKLKK